MQQIYRVLSPWAQVDDSDAIALCPRLDSLSGKKIGLFSHFKEHSVRLLQELRDCLQVRFPDSSFSLLQYRKDTCEAENDPEFAPILNSWLKDLDAVVCAYGDMGSCALFVGYNTAYIEKLGKPTVILSDREFIPAARSGAAARGVPSVRIAETEMHDLSFVPSLDGRVRDEIIRPAAEGVTDRVIEALTAPLTEAEKRVIHRSNDHADEIFEGSLDEVRFHFYTRGYTNGTPVIPPTEEAVVNMLRGTDLSGTHIVAKLPPMRGVATVEKIAVNAVMAGCLPIHMPVLIAAVEAMTDTNLHLEGYTCSRGVWAPMAIINGPIRRDIDMNCGAGLLSPYRLAASCIGRAIAYIIMNISGVRPQIEDLSGMGHEGRFGICIAEDEENSPWTPFHTRFGLDVSDSAVTLFWPAEHSSFRSRETNGILSQMCQAKDFGFRPGCCFIMSPEQAKTMATDGLSKENVIDYIHEYARRPAAEVPSRWLRDNNHMPESVALPVDSRHWARSFWDRDHLLLVVAGEGYGSILTGGGDHGGPACRKIHLPKNWDALCQEYGHIKLGKAKMNID